MQGQKAKWKIKHEGEKERVQSISFFEKEEKEMLKNAKKKKKKKERKAERTFYCSTKAAHWQFSEASNPAKGTLNMNKELPVANQYGTPGCIVSECHLLTGLH